jgi:hypothetical protein
MIIHAGKSREACCRGKWTPNGGTNRYWTRAVIQIVLDTSVLIAGLTSNRRASLLLLSEIGKNASRLTCPHRWSWSTSAELDRQTRGCSIEKTRQNL